MPFMIAAPAAPVAVVASAVPVGAPASNAPVLEADASAPPNSDFAQKAVLEAKLMETREIALDRKCTDMAWGIGFIVCVVLQYGLGFYEVNNALTVSASRWEMLASKQALPVQNGKAQCGLWAEGDTATLGLDPDLPGPSYRVVSAMDGPTEKETPANTQAWPSTNTCGQTGTTLSTWSLDTLDVCGPPALSGWSKPSRTPSALAPTFGTCPPAPAPPVSAVASSSGGDTCEYSNDGACDEPDGSGDDYYCETGTDTTDCSAAGGGRRMLRVGSSSRNRNREPAPPPPAVEYAVSSVNISATADYMMFETREIGNDHNWEMFTWGEADAACAAAGARLCSAEELVFGLGGGCTAAGGASSRFWAAEECDGGYVASSPYTGRPADKVAGSIAEGVTHCAATCDDMRRAVKCCADNTANKALAAQPDLTANAVGAAAVVVEESTRPAKRPVKTLKQKQAKEKEEGNPYAGGSFIGSMVTSLFACVLVSLASGISYIYLMKENAVCMTWFANLFFPVILFFVGMFVMSINPFMGFILWILCALAVCMLFCWRTQLELAAKLLGMASCTLLDNGGLIPAKIGLMFLEICVTLPILVFNVSAYFQVSLDYKQSASNPISGHSNRLLVHRTVPGKPPTIRPPRRALIASTSARLTTRPPLRVTSTSSC